MSFTYFYNRKCYCSVDKESSARERSKARFSGRMWSSARLSAEAQGSLGRRTFPQLQHPTKYLRLRELVHIEDAKGHGESHPTMEPAT